MVVTSDFEANARNEGKKPGLQKRIPSPETKQQFKQV